MPPPENAHQVAILLALHNGAKMLLPQLESFASQTHSHWHLIVSDDGSTDNGRDLVAAFAQASTDREIAMLSGPCRGFAQNFLSLLGSVAPDTPFAALSDQDDVWLPDKIERALSHLAAVPKGMPALYGSRTWICDEAFVRKRLSPLFRQPPSFRNALVQNISGGNTMVLNRAALDLVQAARHEADEIIAHDWWLYQIITGVGGRVIYDPEPTVLYRQHGGNQIGANDTLGASAHRLGMLARGRFRQWNDVNLTALSASAHRLTPRNRQILSDFVRIRKSRIDGRLAGFHRMGLYRQTRRGQAALWFAAALGLL